MSVRARVSVVTMRPEHITALMPYEHDMFGTESWSADGYRDELADTVLRHYVAAEGVAAEGVAAEGVTAEGVTAEGVAAADGTAAELLGWAGVMVVGETAEILTVGVVPSARRTGLGRRLLGVLVAEAVRRGAVEVFLEVRTDNAAAIALYEADGFARIGLRRGYYDGGRVDALTMRRDLTDPGAEPAGEPE